MKHLYPLIGKSIRITIKTLAIIAAIIAIFLTIIYAINTPSNNRDWREECAIIPTVSINANQVTIINIRNQSYDQNGPLKLQYYNATYDLDNIEKLWFIVEPFSLWGASAHTFVTFGFSDGQYVSVSVEARFEKNETYGAVKGILDQFELWYVWGSETDLIARRTNWLQEDMYLYPINTSKEKMQQLFLEMATYTQSLTTHPEFYNTVTNTCTSSLADRVKIISPGRIGWTIATTLPGYSDEYIYKKGMINTTLPFEQIRPAFAITQKALNCSQVNFSECIRQPIVQQP